MFKLTEVERQELLAYLDERERGFSHLAIYGFWPPDIPQGRDGRLEMLANSVRRANKKRGSNWFVRMFTGRSRS